MGKPTKPAERLNPFNDYLFLKTMGKKGEQKIINLLKRGKSPEEIIRDYNNELTELVNATEKPPRRNQ